MTLQEQFERTPVPGGLEAQRRAWAVVAEGFAQRPPRRPRRASGAALLAIAGVVAAGTVTAALAAGVSTPGELVRKVLDRDRSAPVKRTALGPLPADGRLLVTSPRGAWIVARDGARRHLGPAAGASWSPRGLYVAVWGPGVKAVAPDGRVAWRFRPGGFAEDARWSPDGFRLAFRSGENLAVIGGDGRGARRLDERIRPVAPAWRPDTPRTLAWQAADGHVVVRDVTAYGWLWRSGSAPPGPVRELAWSADGRRLLVRARGGVLVARLPDRSLRHVDVRSGERVIDASWAPRGRRLAVVVRDRPRRTSHVLVSDGALGRRERVFSVSSALGSVTWSPDGRRLVVVWPRADQWLYVPADGRGRIVAVAGVRKRFGGAASVAGWCCPPP